MTSKQDLVLQACTYLSSQKITPTIKAVGDWLESQGHRRGSNRDLASHIRAWKELDQEQLPPPPSDVLTQALEHMRKTLHHEAHAQWQEQQQAYEEKIASLEEHLKQLFSDYEQAQKEKHEKTQTLTSLEKEHASLQKDFDDLQEAHHTLAQQEALQQKNHTLAQAQWEQHTADLRLQVEQANAGYQSLSQSFKALQDKLDAQLQALDTGYKEKLAAAQTEILDTLESTRTLLEKEAQHQHQSLLQKLESSMTQSKRVESVLEQHLERLSKQDKSAQMLQSLHTIQHHLESYPKLQGQLLENLKTWYGETQKEGLKDS